MCEGCKKCDKINNWAGQDCNFHGIEIWIIQKIIAYL